MSDITKCSGENCRKKETCWRFLAPSDELLQSFFVEIPFSFVSEQFYCEMYWKIEK